MTRQERRKRRRQRRRRMQAALLASLLFALVLIVTLRIRETAPEPVAERTSALAAERQALTYIAPARPEAAEETPEELTVEPEPENRYAELHFSDEDVYILACLVYHEARGESFEGQVAVVEVVLNRMLSDYFPDTVEEVVFQKYGDVWQFSPRSVPLLGGAGQGAISRGAYRHRGAGAHSFRGYGLFFDRAL